MRICCVCGARPNFMKIAAVVRALDDLKESEDQDTIQATIVHTGQHYDHKLSQVMFEDLELPRPDIDLEVGSASHAVQTAEIMKRFEPVVLNDRPDLVVVVGDVNSTVACALVAVKLGIPVAHVEAGLRSGDRSMPEEINRIMTDSISSLLFVSEPSGMENLEREGLPPGHAHFVGNVMIDTLLRHRDRADASDVLDRLGLEEGGYAALTLHRPSNVDDPDTFGSILDALTTIEKDLPIVFPVHPRTAKQLGEFGFRKKLDKLEGLRLEAPLGYLDFLKLMASSRIVLTDSGGIQEETTILGVPCLTLRENTERPVTIVEGTNQLVGSDTAAILAGYEKAMASTKKLAPPEKWDGQTGARIVEILTECAKTGIPSR